MCCLEVPSAVYDFEVFKEALIKGRAQLVTMRERSKHRNLVARLARALAYLAFGGEQRAQRRILVVAFRNLRAIQQLLDRCLTKPSGVEHLLVIDANPLDI